jgi:hypothetical protein
MGIFPRLFCALDAMGESPYGPATRPIGNHQPEILRQAAANHARQPAILLLLMISVGRV